MQFWNEKKKKKKRVQFDTTVYETIDNNLFMYNFSMGIIEHSHWLINKPVKLNISVEVDHDQCDVINDSGKCKKNIDSKYFIKKKKTFGSVQYILLTDVSRRKQSVFGSL